MEGSYIEKIKFTIAKSSFAASSFYLATLVKLRSGAIARQGVTFLNVVTHMLCFLLYCRTSRAVVGLTFWIQPKG